MTVTSPFTTPVSSGRLPEIPGFRSGWQRRFIANVRQALRGQAKPNHKFAFLVGVREALNMLECASLPPAYGRQMDVKTLQCELAHINNHLRRLENRVSRTGGE